VRLPCSVVWAAGEYVSLSIVILSDFSLARVPLSRRIPSPCAVAARGAAMWRSIDVFNKDLSLCVIHVLRVCIVSNDRCLSSACRPQSAADLTDHPTSEAPRFRGQFTPRDWASDRPPTRRTIDGKVARYGVALLHIWPISGPYNRRPVRGRHVASPIEILRIVLRHC